MYKLFFAAFLILFYSCNKDDKTITESKTAVEVKEAISGLPVGNADVVLFQSTYGGIGYKEYFSGTTNADGICEVPSQYFSDHTITFNVVADKYWPYIIPTQRSNKVTLQAEGWIKVEVGQSSNSYPANSRIRMYAIAQSNNRYDSFFESESELTAGTTKIVRAFGNDMNDLFYQITDANNQILKEGSLGGIDVRKSDTATVPFAGY